MFSVTPFQAREMRVGAMDSLGHDEPEFLRHVEGSFVKHLVMEGTESNPIRDLVWTSGLLPLDMSGFKSNRSSLISNPKVESANRTLVLIRPKDAVPEFRIPIVGVCGPESEPNSIRDIGMERRGKVSRE